MARKAITIRFPHEVLVEARKWKPKDQSLNEFIVRAVEQQSRRRLGLPRLDEAAMRALLESGRPRGARRDT